MNPLEKALNEAIDTLPEFDGEGAWAIDRYISDLDDDGNREAFLGRLLAAVCAVERHKPFHFGQLPNSLILKCERCEKEIGVINRTTGNWEYYGKPKP